MPLSSTKVIKVIVVTDNLEKTVNAYRNLFGTGEERAETGEHKQVREPYTVYCGAPITDTPMKVENVFSDNFWFEIIQPLGERDPWAVWLKTHGTSIYSVCLISDGPIEADEELMKQAGYASIFKQEKGYEAYEYFDTAADLGVLVEVKEQYGA